MPISGLAICSVILNKRFAWIQEAGRWCCPLMLSASKRRRQKSLSGPFDACLQPEMSEAAQLPKEGGCLHQPRNTETDDAGLSAFRHVSLAITR
jgi:hypothetical protein